VNVPKRLTDHDLIRLVQQTRSKEILCHFMERVNRGTDHAAAQLEHLSGFDELPRHHHHDILLWR
jgi:hypothetical protein